MKKFTCLVAAIVLCGGVAFGQGYSDSFILNTDAERINLVASGSTQSVIVAAEPTIAQVPFDDAVAFGLVDGYSIVNKFGHNGAVAAGGGDIWSGGGTYAFYPTSAQAMSVVSSSGADDAASTGAHTVIFYGLDEDWLEANETVTMDGATPVALTNTYRRMYRGVVLTIGTAESNVGNISVTNSAGIVGVYIAAEDGQSQQAIYTIPAGKSALFKKGYVFLKD